MRANIWIRLGIVFVLASLAADYAFTRLVVYNTPSGYAGRLHHLYLENGDEIPIFGSSKVEYGYIPAEMGLNVYNYGVRGASKVVTETLLEIELAKPKTSPVIIDLKPDDDRGIGNPCVYIPYMFDARIRQLVEGADAMEWRYYFPALRYFGYYDYCTRDFINEHIQVHPVDHGYTPSGWTFDRAGFEADVRSRLQVTNGYFPDDEENGKLIAQVKAHPGRLFFFVFSPVHSSCLVNFQNAKQFADFKARLGSLPNAVVLDYQQNDFPDEWFKDTNHLLPEAAQAFSKRLGAKIRDILAARGAAGPGRGPAVKLN